MANKKVGTTVKKSSSKSSSKKREQKTNYYTTPGQGTPEGSPTGSPIQSQSVLSIEASLPCVTIIPENASSEVGTQTVPEVTLTQDAETQAETMVTLDASTEVVAPSSEQETQTESRVTGTQDAETQVAEMVTVDMNPADESTPNVKVEKTTTRGTILKTFRGISKKYLTKKTLVSSVAIVAAVGIGYLAGVSSVSNTVSSVVTSNTTEVVRLVETPIHDAVLAAGAVCAQRLYEAEKSLGMCNYFINIALKREQRQNNCIRACHSYVNYEGPLQPYSVQEFNELFKLGECVE